MITSARVPISANRCAEAARQATEATDVPLWVLIGYPAICVAFLFFVWFINRTTK